MQSNQCINCKHFIEQTRCKAFEEIPAEIITGKVKHSEPLTDQKNSIVYEPLEESK